VTKKQPKDQDQDFEKQVLRRLKTKTQVSRTTTTQLIFVPSCTTVSSY